MRTAAGKEFIAAFPTDLGLNLTPPLQLQNSEFRHYYIFLSAVLRDFVVAKLTIIAVFDPPSAKIVLFHF